MFCSTPATTRCNDSTASGTNFNWVSTAASSENNFGGEGALDVFDNQVAVEVDERWTTLDPSDYPGGEAPPNEGDPQWQENATWGEALVYSPPRNFRVGVRFAW